MAEFEDAIERRGIGIIAIDRFDIGEVVSLGQRRSGAGVTGVDRQGLFEETPRVIQERGFPASAQIQHVGFDAAQVIFISLPRGGWFQQRSLSLGAFHMSRQDCDNRARHFVLDRENVVQFAVVPLGPAVGAGHGVDELRGDADAAAAAPDASLHDVACAQLLYGNRDHIGFW
jgi:hypothetical protein